jgi:glucosamine--fructose-6-phosphate aminotransferase (isomerizing)
LYWAGRNNGVAEELRLKTNEITRKKSDFLEGTYAVHGIEEVMGPKDAVIVVSPFADEEQKFSDVLTRGAGVPVVAIAARPTSFPTVEIQDFGDFGPYLELVAGWRLLVEVGIRAGIDLDKPARARKVGNEFLG